ncbi:MAG TPA: formate dehydrogenase accessory sulfurtransferase FdhD [Syntrophomonas sp.]|jgi:FdhD protein|nr:formate dehydrogenase accessory sulfurtransferase FdhD [Syntrophomonas sp.]
MNEETVYRLIHRYSPEKGMEEFWDVIINEQCFKVYINDIFYKDICCTPSHLDELIIGHLFMEHQISSSGDIKKIEIDDTIINVSVISQPPVQYHIENNADINCPAAKLSWLMQMHLNVSVLHKQTGGVHVMSLATQEGLLVSREDIGRHNAVDKLYGYCLLNGINCSDKIFLSSGRVSHEIIQKLVAMGIQLVVSRAAVTSLAQKIAEKSGITVLGFARGERFNIYTHPHRILAESGR